MKKIFLTLVFLLLSFKNYSNANTGNLVIVTSFSKDLTEKFKTEFEKKYPGIKVEILQKGTPAGVKYIQETKSNNATDLFWVSAPDANEVLKKDSLLVKYTPKVSGIPEKIGSYPVHDKDGYYLGFAASGYGIMWNTRYLSANKLPKPKEWSDLIKPIYYNHIGMSSPSRSGTTHLTLEAILQGEGFLKGWQTIKFISGNFKTVAATSFAVPDGVNSGDFGIGIVIDFFGLSSAASGFPVEFVYPTITALVPANIAIIKNAPNQKNAELFIEFLLSNEGQTILLDPKIRRLPVNPETYSKAPKDYPNPYKDKSIGKAVNFDVNLSEKRYSVINALFDAMITYRLNDLKEAVAAINKAEIALAKKENAQSRLLIKEAKELVAKLPITEAQANDPAFNAIFTKSRIDAKDNEKYAGTRQAEIEADWDKQIVSNYSKAKEKAQQALKSL